MGTVPALEFLPRAIALARNRPVLLAGGIAAAVDTAAALSAGAAAVVAGTRFLLTHESGAHPEYQRRVLEARTTLETTVFGLGWPARHRVVPNNVTSLWCGEDGAARRVPALINAWSGPLARVTPEMLNAAILRLQRPWLPLFSPMVPVEGAPAACVDRAALYAGDSARRMTEVISAKQAVAELAA